MGMGTTVLILILVGLEISGTVMRIVDRDIPHLHRVDSNTEMTTTPPPFLLPLPPLLLLLRGMRMTCREGSITEITVTEGGLLIALVTDHGTGMRLTATVIIAVLTVIITTASTVLPVV